MALNDAQVLNTSTAVNYGLKRYRAFDVYVRWIGGLDFSNEREIFQFDRKGFPFLFFVAPGTGRQENHNGNKREQAPPQRCLVDQSTTS